MKLFFESNTRYGEGWFGPVVDFFNSQRRGSGREADYTKQNWRGVKETIQFLRKRL